MTTQGDWREIVRPKTVKSLPDVITHAREAKLLPQKALPDTWVVDCRKIGNGLPALK